ncbi:hypothetical protein B0J12DRAFT_693132 [Macrophomina phaseolina]|uniref:Uncharacterized protein n=1 Tax=Macrophomina phaseolina TaxID=35725 RepID=A0ABQ8GUE7_9PEZI|nr:hypothetical protein B0J12DRAFT_693132 [Macrophomina phaseolina]
MQFSKLCLTFGLAIAATLASGMAAAPASQAHAIVMAGNVKDIPVGRDGNSCDADTVRTCQTPGFTHHHLHTPMHISFDEQKADTTPTDGKIKASRAASRRLETLCSDEVKLAEVAIPSCVLLSLRAKARSGKPPAHISLHPITDMGKHSVMRFIKFSLVLATVSLTASMAIPPLLKADVDLPVHPRNHTCDKNTNEINAWFDCINLCARLHGRASDDCKKTFCLKLWDDGLSALYTDCICECD